MQSPKFHGKSVEFAANRINDRSTNSLAQKAVKLLLIDRLPAVGVVVSDLDWLIAIRLKIGWICLSTTIPAVSFDGLLQQGEPTHHKPFRVPSVPSVAHSP